MNYKLISGFLATVVLSACASFQDIPPNSNITEVNKVLGSPQNSCPTSDGKQYYLWGRASKSNVVGALVDSNGTVGPFTEVHTEKSFARLDSGNWTQQDVLCSFGHPYEIERLGFGEKRALIWTYRYEKDNAWPALMHVYFGGDETKVTHRHSGPDPFYEQDYWGWPYPWGFGFGVGFGFGF
ncbi:hypothetical protein [Taylorella equigenitalis]|uniref:Lipoprotein n=3 Tax=Taylorella equigenitalis TaxID=29575 RepID=A0ABN4B0M5_9BURK|nr:hypothetical protein [Taylorella equigenitalis]ADU91145.1 putative lipoprotein [Taylorella equigenitalis MCE9]AFN36250.1 putative lipoprotein [Taylorella equigenitalis ATCC 35865]ASY30821.1 hypothetical protein B9Z30_05545 [Taylorella equigenitalis]ASY38122.1 hypothetical protein CA605_05445 [Taylorella equigenitalis]ASY39649.1 hypothetical protein CA604_05940 [Taylorella equigenitalis]